MNFPQIPTDNLYKFMALSGLAIALISFFLPMKQVRDIEMEIVEIQEQARLLNEKNDFLDIKKGIIERLKSAPAEEAEKIFIERQQLVLESVRILAKLERVKFLKDEIKNLKTIIGLLSGLGVFLSVLGFILWYQKVQRYQDKVLKDNAN